MSTQNNTQAGSQPDTGKAAAAQETKQSQPLSEQELEAVSGGLNPQPLPPGPCRPTEIGH